MKSRKCKCLFELGYKLWSELSGNQILKGIVSGHYEPHPEDRNKFRRTTLSVIKIQDFSPFFSFPLPSPTQGANTVQNALHVTTDTLHPKTATTSFRKLLYLPVLFLKFIFILLFFKGLLQCRLMA